MAKVCATVQTALAADMPPPLPQPPLTSSATSAPRLLIVDDSPDNLRLLVQLLKARGYQLSIARDGQDGYQRAAADPPDLILLDVYMPRADGFAACRLLKSDPRTQAIPVIFLTAADETQARLNGFALGAVDYICKPFVADEVLARVNLHISLAQRLRLAASPPPANTSPAVADPDLVLVHAARGLLLADLASPPPMTELVTLLGTNERRLNDAFRRHTDMTVFVWLREQRLRKGQQLLASTSLDIAAIAEQLGYHSQSHFSTAFRERFSASPSDYRAACAQAPRPE
jgi:DNA-binding response OmpR family regulator